MRSLGIFHELSCGKNPKTGEKAERWQMDAKIQDGPADTTSSNRIYVPDTNSVTPSG